ncbi:MAG: hypothetical protein IJR88_03510 [Clostridia bacterium]|nr:hypothetical protein [Clostridia bacterium]
MSLKDDWKNTGKGIGKSFAGLGKAIVKSAKVGVDAVYDKASGETKDPNEPKETGLRQSWSEVGHSFGSAGKSLGKAAAGTAKKVTDSLDHEETPAEEKTAEEEKKD